MEKSSWAHYSAIEGATIGEDTFGIPERSSDQIQGNPPRPISEEPRALSLRPLSANSDGGITRVQFPAAVGVHFPRGGPFVICTDRQRVDLQLVSYRECA
jgi:hypothetical protein